LVKLICATVAAALFLTPAAAGAGEPCWKRVVADWAADEAVDRSYPTSCYREAILKLPEDLRAYSSAPEDIQRALQMSLARRPAVVRRPASASGTGVGANDQNDGVRSDSGGRDPLWLLLFAGALVLLVALAAATTRPRARRRGG
jgi:hypothetical protein